MTTTMADMLPNTYWDLFLGYTAFWLLIGVFCFYLMREQQRLGKRLLERERDLRSKDATILTQNPGVDQKQQLAARG